MKLLLTSFVLMSLASCGSLTQVTSSFPTNQDGYPINPQEHLVKIQGKNPVEVKEILGEVTTFEGFSKKDHFYSGWQKNGVFILVYNKKPGQMLMTYNLDKEKKCIILPFLNSNDFKFKKKAHLAFAVKTGKYCEFPYLTNSGFSPVTSEKLMKEFDN